MISLFFMQRTDKISAGSFDLNKWLYGGYEKEVITMIAGPPGSGKTNFCVLAAASQAKKKNKVLFIDTEGGFSIDRIRQIVGENYEDILENILLLSPASFDEQQKSFSQMLNKLKKDQIGLVVVDGMATLYRLELGEISKSGTEKEIREFNQKIAQQLRILSEISRKEKIPILITNQVYSGFVSEEDFRKGVKKEVNFVGGDLLKYWSKCIIELKLENRKRKAILLKHRSLPVKEFNFEIKDKGIFRRRWI